MAGDRDADEETRNIMMQNLFGDQSEEEEEEEVDSEHEAAANQSDYPSEDVEADAEIEVDVDGEQEGEEEQEGQELEAEVEGEDEGEVDGEDAAEGQGEVEVESELEAHDIDVEQVESEGERVQSSPEREVSDERVGSEGKYAESEDEGYGQRAAISRRRGVYDIESEGSEENHFVHPHNEDEEVDLVDNARNISSPVEQKDKLAVRDVFGDSDVDEQDEYGVQNDLEQDSHRSPMEEEEIYEKDLKPEDIVPDEDAQYEFEDENLDQKTKEKPIGPPLEMNIPLHPPPGRPDQMHMIRVSNIMGIEPKPFDSMTYVEEDVFVTDESGTKKRIRLEDNIVRWRTVKNRDGKTNYESNARFVQWSDGSLQLLIGNEVLDISVQEADHDQAHLFLRHGKGILQSQGRLLRKMKFMPSSLSSKSHRLLTALVDSRHKKVYKVKNCITDIDPEREKEEKRKIEGQTIRANEQLNRKREKVNRKYSQPVNRGRELSPGFLEDALDEEDEHEDYYSSRKFTARRRFEDDLEAEAQAEKRIINAKRPNLQKSTPRKPAQPAARLSRRPVEDYSESEREESEYETDGEDIEASPGVKDKERDYEDDYEEEADEEVAGIDSASEEEEPRRNVRESGGSSLKRKEIDSDVDSPPRKAVHRRKAVVFDSDDD
ncbi:hypothetical protein KFK09_016081 [Dendrobium nobile]|uniref:Uncharacterized protein n=1 Tax=Dendrobium nobile TaxID=94219 RepID=A0A8T3AYV8_DENNO|nr:hypothetical protein KFK09_016081 [Dendrobium nobile]